jgi:hypothetical protein
MTDAEAETDAEVTHKSMIEGPCDEPVDGEMSLHELHRWVITEGGRFTTTPEIADEAIRRHGVANLTGKQKRKRLTAKQKRKRGIALAIKDADEAICRAHVNELIHLLGIKPGLLGPPQRIPPDDLRGADVDILGGQPMSDRQKLGQGREYGEINQLCLSGFMVTIWTAVSVDKREVREAFPYGRALSAAVVEAPSKEVDAPETRRAKPGQKSPKNRSGGRSPKLRESAIAALREMFPNGVPRSHPNWTQEAIRAAVVKKIGSVSLDTIKRAITKLRAEQSNAEES